VNQTRDVRRDQVVAAVLRLIGEEGLAGLSTAALAREAGMSEANLYRHFKNKKEILLETVARIGQGLRENVEIVVKSQSAPLDRLRSIFELHLRYVGQNHGIPRLVYSDEPSAGDHELKAMLLEMISGYAQLLKAIIGEGKHDGSIAPGIDPGATALTFIGMVQVTILRWVMSDFTLSIEDEGLTLWRNFEACISHGEPPVRQSTGTKEDST